MPAEKLLSSLDSSLGGLGQEEANTRLALLGSNSIEPQADLTVARLFLRQIENPLVLILIFGAGVSIVLREWIDAAIILAVVFGSALLGFYQEFRASRAVAELRRRLILRTRVLRGGRETTVPVADIVPGDVVLLSAGNLVPGDGLVLDANDFLVSEATLTGETFPVEKKPGVVPSSSPIGHRTNAVFLGSSVRSGTARILIAETGRRTSYGAIAARLAEREPETDFARGVRRFGAMLLKVMIVIVLAVITVNQLLGRPVAESLLFAVALAVGLSPELLPAIISVTLSAGARDLSKGGVIVRRLESIENLGSMDVLCTDKTGTLTEGTIVLQDAVDPAGNSADAVRKAGYLNALLQTGISNPLDAALVADARNNGFTLPKLRKIAEIPYDFVRRRLTIVVESGEPTSHRMITKGAFDDIFAICTGIDSQGERRTLDAAARTQIEALFRSRGEKGFRALAVAEKRLPARTSYNRADEAEMTLLGLLLFSDPPKPDVAKTVSELRALGIDIKIITGDNRYVTGHVAAAVGMADGRMLTGQDIGGMTDHGLRHAAPNVRFFVEIDPQQKERIVRTLQGGGHSVGFLGDGINDAPALRAADVGISVDKAADVARESADVVLLRRDLAILRQGVADGRKTFTNTLKYISITTSANFGNMVSMALATPLLPFLPLLPKQILLNNFLSSLPSVAISSDNVDPERLVRPQRWSIRDIRHFMILFGLVSSIFDLVTFAVLLLLYKANEGEFQTAWFVVSMLTELAVVIILRTRHFALRSRPGTLLLWSTAAMTLITFLAPFSGGVARLFGFTPLAMPLMAITVIIVICYAAATEAAKMIYYRARRPADVDSAA